MSGRADITAGLSELLRRRLRSESRRFAEEVTFMRPECRVDFVAYKPAPYGWADIGGIEQGTVSFYEVKSCMADYTSGNGLNFYGDENWLVAPSVLVDALAGSGLGHRVGVYVPVPDGSTAMREMKDPTPYEGQVEGWSLHIRSKPGLTQGYFRRYALVEVLAQMIYAGVRR